MISTLARHLVESSLFCVLVSIAAFGLRHSSAAARHALWLIGFSKFAVPTAWLAATGAHLTYVFPASSWVSALAVQVSTIFAAADRLFPSLHMHAPWPGLFVMLWLTGAAVLITVWLVRLRASYPKPSDASAEEQRALESARKRLGVLASVQLRSSSRDQEPGLIGLIKACVVIPEGLSGLLTGPELESVLLHELGHAQRKDNLTTAFAHCVVCLFWFHPLVWWMERQLLLERERACDELVIAFGAERQTYIAGILKVCRFHLNEAAAGVSTISGSDLSKRLDLIRRCAFAAPVRYTPRLLLACFAITMTAFPVAGGYCQQCVSDVQNSGLGNGPQTSRQVRWLVPSADIPNSRKDQP